MTIDVKDLYEFGKHLPIVRRKGPADSIMLANENPFPEDWNAFIDMQIRQRDNAKMAYVVMEAKTLPKELLHALLLELGQFYEELKE